MSEAGLQLYSIQDLPIGTILNLLVLFQKGYQLGHFRVSAKIVWREQLYEIDFMGYRYGLRFIEIMKEDNRELSQFLCKQFNLEVLKSSILF